MTGVSGQWCWTAQVLLLPPPLPLPYGDGRRGLGHPQS